MRKYLLLLVCCFISAEGFAQNKKLNETGTAGQQEVYPVHVTDKLNNTAEIQALRSKYQDYQPQRSKMMVDEVGDEREFFVYNLETKEFDTKMFRLMRKGSLTQIWFEIAEIDAAHLTESVADSMLKYLEDVSNSYSFDPTKGIIELSNNILGDPPNYDGDGLVDFLITDIIDGYDPESGGGYTAGFFFEVDQLPDVNPLSYRSNERDILYIDSFPGIFRDNNNDPIIDPIRPLPTLAHEYQHLIHYNYDPNEITFVNEGQSNFASLLSGYIPHNSFGSYLADTNVPLYRWSDSGDTVLADYGRSASFTGYLWDQLGFENSGLLTQNISTGTTGIEQAIQAAGSSLSIDDLLVNWGIANLVNDKISTSNNAYGYDHEFMRTWKAPVAYEDPQISNRKVQVQPGSIEYLGFQQVEDLTISVSHIGLQNGYVNVITVNGDSVQVYELNSGESFTTTEGINFESVYIMLVYSDPDSTSPLSFTVNASGSQTYTLTEISTYSETPKFYWKIPYLNASNQGRLGFSNRYTTGFDALVYSLELFIVSGTDGTTGETIGVKGDGLLRIAAYTDVNGNPGEPIVADSINFDQLTTGWQTFNVSDWDLNLAQGDVIHIVYEPLVENIESGNNTIPLRLDDGNGEQDVSHILTDANQFIPFFSDTESGGEHNVWNKLVLATAYVTANEEPASTPLQFQLNQNYPNPFNPNTVISYQLSKNSNVKIEIFDLAGRKVATLIDKNMPAGNHEISFNAQNLASGLYLYRLKAGDFMQTRKMILMK